MSVSLLSTKLHIPRTRPNGVSRSRLIKKLSSCMEHPGSFVLLSGPAGFGKTTLLSQFAVKLQQPIAWVSLDEKDNDPIRFWTCLITACQAVQGEIGESGLALLQTAQPLSDETIPTILINDLVELENSLVVVLDDYHTIQNPSIHTGLAFLLDNLPEHLHLIISTRVDPPWPLARYRAGGQLIEIRVADLRFTMEETAAFLNDAMGLNLSTEELAALEARTEGWIASLQLAAVSMKGREDLSGFIKAFTGSHVFVAEYLLDEVLARQSEEVKAFLLQTSLLERLNANLCEAVIEHPDSQKMLRDLYQANLFIVPLDDEGQWYRYHHLFADLLKAHLQQTTAEVEIKALHERAMIWYEQNELPHDAIYHALAAKDFESAARLIGDNAYQVMTRGQLTTLLGWVEALPADVIQQHPKILVSKAWTLALAGAVRQVEPLLQQAEAQFETDDRTSAALEVFGNAAAIRAFFAVIMGEYPRALKLAERADALLPESNVHVRWLVPYTIGAAHRGQGRYDKAVDAFARQAEMGETYDNLIIWATGVTEVAIVRRLQGRLHEAEEVCRQALRWMDERGATQFGSLAKLEVPLVEVLREWNELDESQQRVTDVLARMRNWPMPTDRIFAHLAQIRVQEARGNLAGASETLQAAKDLKASQPVLSNLARSVDLSEIRLSLASGDITTAARLMDKLQPGTSRSISLREQELTMLARLRLAQNRPDEAEEILSPLASEAEAGGRNGALIEILAVQACVLNAKGHRETALATLARAMTIGEPERFIRIFVDEGERMRQLLAALISQLTTDHASFHLKDYVAKLLEAFSGDPRPDVVDAALHKESDLIEPLTARELEVLQLIAAGDSNQTIADKLVITLSAVKKHTGNIFRKLNVSSRTQAIARARLLGLLSSG